MPFKVIFDLRIRRDPLRVTKFGGTLLRVTLGEDSLSIVDLVRADGKPLVILERAYSIGGHVYKLEQSIRWGNYLRANGFPVRYEALSEEEAELTRNEFDEFISTSVVLVHPDLSKKLDIKKGARLNIGLYADDIDPGFRSFYPVLRGRVKKVHQMEIDEYRTDAPRSNDEIDALRSAER